MEDGLNGYGEIVLGHRWGGDTERNFLRHTSRNVVDRDV